jgi:hypothetical protein
MRRSARHALAVRRPLVLVAAAGLLLAGSLVACTGSAAPSDVHEEPALVEPIEGTDGLHRITLTDRAAQRLGIQVTEAAAEPGGPRSVRIPYSSIIYDADGDAFAYVVVEEPLVFQRISITVKDVVPDDSGGHALLSDGLEPGQRVVAVGVAELYGTESSVGH